ncbi:Gfo/Idh/MocA family oxidoreductase [Phototrophicus methaneseepsis]|uniref:Gfo/Idh/MocA family oxidoreductase n=1 Tax=Phototrophicus methaneseepsis TaxID=2710758 RepID=A0A7S8EC02_9CHLR|nr:Gfo/Idh/MocA family oxidoreductase [Phototrophicus methaneseepsis]QPC84152.1 Gfo/Idh/MocA family oxidoreductase [Phototrophicus methaneseepsis]
MKEIGYVGVAHIHTPGFVDRLNKRSDFHVKAVWDKKPERAQITAEKLSTQTVADLSDILGDDEIEAVVICSETDDHEELVEKATAAGKHLFVEKPLGISGPAAYRMANAIDKAGVIFQTGHFMRGQAPHLFIKQQIEAGTLGKITRVRHSNVHNGSIGHWFESGWFEDGWMWMTDTKQAGVGGFGDLGAHSIDILMWLFGDIARVTAQIDRAFDHYDCDEYGESLIRFENGIIGTMAAGWVDVLRPMPVMVAGTEGTIYLDQNNVYFKSDHVEGADGTTPWTDLPEALPHAFELFLDALQGEDVPLITAQEMAARAAVVDAFYEADKTSSWVQPKTNTES